MELLAISLFTLSGIAFIYILRFSMRSTRFLEQLFWYIAGCGLSDFSKKVLYFGGNGDVSLLYYGCLIFPDIIFLGILVSNRKSVSTINATIVFGILMALCLHGIILDGFTSTIIAIKTYAVLTLWLIFEPEYYLPTRAEIQNFLMLLFCLILISGIYGLFQFLTGYFGWESNWFKYSPTKMSVRDVTNGGKFFRAFSLFSGIQEYSLILTYVLSLLAFLTHNKLKIIGSITIVLFLISTGSKTTILALIISWVFYFTKLYRSALLLLSTFCLSVAFIYTRPSYEIYQFVLLLREKLPHGIASMIDPITIMPRIIIMIEFFKLNQTWFTIIVGHGFGSSRGTHIFDNSYLMIFYELGCLGIATMLGTVILFFKAASNILDNPNCEIVTKSIAKAFIVFVITGIISQFFSQLIAIRTFYILFVSCISWTIMVEHNLQQKVSASNQISAVQQ